MPRQLYFHNSTFRKGKNITVRKGSYWHNTKVVNIKINQSIQTISINTKLMRFRNLKNADLKFEHDPGCRTIKSLYYELKSIYPQFTRNTNITIIDFKVKQ